MSTLTRPATHDVHADRDERLAWHALDADAVLASTGSSHQGLTTAQAADRLSQDGPNELPEGKVRGPAAMVWEQLSSVMVLILIGAAVLSLMLGKLLEAGSIAIIVALFVGLGFAQEYRADRAIAALRRMTVPTVRVTRDGTVSQQPAHDLVVGDVVLLEAGDLVPADLRLIETATLRVQESALTGESEPVDKAVQAVGAEVSLGDRRSMAYSGTHVTHGRGRGVVVATGAGTELGRIASLLQSVETAATPLQRRLDQVGRSLAVAGVLVAALVVLLGALGGEPMSELLLTAISVAVAVIPEGLPAVVTFTLAIGAQRMLRRQALIRRLPAVETLGSVTVICSDKTGTLTQNRMQVVTIDVAGAHVDLDQPHAQLPAAARLALAAGVLCNDGTATVGANGELSTVGDPTETALLVAADRLGHDTARLRAGSPRVAEHPFDSERKRMSTVHTNGASVATWAGVPHAFGTDDTVVFVKGAVDGMLDRTVAVWEEHGPAPFTEEHRARIHRRNDELARTGLRVLGVAFRTLPDGDAEQAEDDLVLLALVGIVDPARPEARDAIALSRDAGIRTVMITGDHPATAAAIADDLGIATAGAVLTGSQLDGMNADEFSEAVRTHSVFARVSPEHKLRIVEALQDQGEVVAMTGDGVNDAPALRRADVGVAMGITGTDVSKSAADVVLRDDNFATIVAAVEEGRVIYDNVRRFVKFAVAGNIGKIGVMVVWPAVFLIAGGDRDHAVALLPLQLLWLNLMTDGLLGMALGMEPGERGVMRRPPHTPSDSIWSGGLGRQAAWTGAAIGMIALIVGIAYDAMGRGSWQTVIFTSLGFLQVFQAIGTRSTDQSLRSVGLWSNPVMTAMVGVVVALQLLALYSPLRTLLGLEPLHPVDLGVCIAAGAVLLVGLETLKAHPRRGARTPSPVIARAGAGR